MPTGRLDNRLSQLASYALEPFGSGRYQHLAAIIAESMSGWTADLHYDEDGKSAIVIMPEDPDDAIDPTLIVYASGSAFQLDELHGDAYRRLGEYLSWADVLRAVRIKLIWRGPFPITLH
ncbi:MAG TPA: hypothetical protein VND19_06365 [Acetobacteraceae bacterium]|nr:hypothetical protein [Acetobacteraceae bacterium]